MGKSNAYIPFVLGEETRPKIETFETEQKYSIDITQSIFYEQYCTALSSVAELISYNKIFKDANQHKTRNNIIVFTGDRGSGKTSCMMTVKELLCNMRNKEELFSRLGNITDSMKELLVKTNFHDLETIGPMYFDCNHNILELFIGTLYNKFIEKERDGIEKYNSYCPKISNNRDELFNKFSEAKRNLSLIYKKDVISEYDNLEDLKNLTASMNLRKSLWNLVQTYISYMYGKEHQLVLDIDDIDLNMTNAYVTIEQIRKYLKIPGLIILMSVKLDQLANVIRIEHSKEYKLLLDIDPTKYYEVVNKLVEKHLTKVFPLSQRIKLPKIKDLLDKNFKIIHTCTFPDGEKEKELTPLKEGMLALIYQKTGLLFYNTTKHPNYIIPSNLRELLNFIHQLYKLRDASSHNEAISNLFYFKDYFFNTWCTNNLKEKYLKQIREAKRIIEPFYINKLILNTLVEHFPILTEVQEEKNKQIKNNPELTFILDKDNRAFNISLGDVLACIDWLEKVCVDQKELMFLFAIKVFYTIHLYENFKYKDEYTNNKENNNNYTLTNNEIGYLDILNGNFFNSEYLDIAPNEDGKLSRTKRDIYCQAVKMLWEYANGLEIIFDEENRELNELSDMINKITSENEKEVLKKMTEFFMLATSYVIDSNQNYFLYRRRNTVYYNYFINPRRKKVCFDILSIFYNILDIKKTYSKYGIEIENYTNDAVSKESALKTQLMSYPLYKEVLDKIKDTYQLTEDIKAEDRLTYITNIRQVEIIEQISHHLQRNRPRSSNILDIYKNIFSSLADFSAKSYDTHKSKGNNYSYSFFNVFKKLMTDINKDDSLKEIFNWIIDSKTKEETK